VNFDSEDPFPFVTEVSYAAQKLHAAEVDAWLGVRAEQIEKSLLESNIPRLHDREFWIGKSVQTFSTPYIELRSLLEDLRALRLVTAETGETLVDLGAGYGRLAHVMAAHFPLAKFVGYEMILARQVEGQRVIESRKLTSAKLIHQDVGELNFETLDASIFFLYDFGSREDVEKCIENLKTLATRVIITVIARGGRSRDIIEKQHPWLSQVIKPLHREHYSIYRSGEKRRENERPRSS
jgi:hypothetical protein